MSLEGTAWVDRNMRAVWDRLRDRVPPSWMPRTKPGKRIVVEELGCGHYGCVMPTGEEDLVCKLTSDPSEASFVSAYLALGVEPEEDGDATGIVHYRAIYQLADASHRGRPIYILWRQEAYDIGLLLQFHGNTSPFLIRKAEEYGYASGEIRSIKEGVGYLDSFLKNAQLARATLQRLSRQMTDREIRLRAVHEAFERAERQAANPQYLKGLPRIGAAIEECRVAAEMAENTSVVYMVGRALGRFLEEGLLLADVHLNNIGRVSKPFEHLVITDPGHVFAIHPRWTYWPGIETL